jgi:hypothetical protein
VSLGVVELCVTGRCQSSTGFNFAVPLTTTTCTAPYPERFQGLLVHLLVGQRAHVLGGLGLDVEQYKLHLKAKA